MLVDERENVRQGLRTLLSNRAGIQVVGEATSVAQAIELARCQRPDVVITDLRLSDGSGVEACRVIRSEQPDAKMIILTSYADEQAIMASIIAGASAYLLKQMRGDQLADAVIAVGRGETLLDPQVTARVLDEFSSMASGTATDNKYGLTETEFRIMKLIAEGKTNREIAAVVYLSDKTVKNYVSNILSKLGLHRRSEAAAYIARRQPVRDVPGR
jgi:DNA-binding NarL/FixJ family response regulator